MKEHFKWAIPPTDEEMKKALQEGIVSFDANVLLDLHRLDKAGMEELKKGIELCKERAWLTNQAAYEYINHYAEMENFTQNFFRSCCTEVDKIESHGVAILNQLKQKLPVNNEDILSTLSSLESALKDFVASSKEKYLQERKPLGNGVKEDEISKWVMRIFNGKIGEPFTAEQLKKQIAEGKRRFAEKIPPGYEDADKPEDRRYGDYFIWVQLQEKARTDKKDMIFVTRDEKKDWFVKLGHGKHGPPLALLKEFHDNTEKQRIFIFKPARFLEKFLPLAEKRPELSGAAKRGIAEIKKYQDHQESLERDVNFGRLPAVSRQISRVNRYDQMSQAGTVYFRLMRDVTRFRLAVPLRMEYCEEIAIYCHLRGGPSSTPRLAATCIATPHGRANIHIEAKDPESPFRAGEYMLIYRLQAIGGGRDDDDDMPFLDPTDDW